VRSLDRFAFLVVASVIVFGASCEEPPATPSAPATNGAAKPTNGDGGKAAPTARAPLGTGVIAGVVKIVGAPTAVTLDVSSVAECAKARAGKPLLSDAFTGADGMFADCVVRVVKGAATRGYPVPDEPVILDQVGCRYEPHVFTIRVGQTLLIRNSDPFFHNVNNPETGINLSMPNTGEVVKKRMFKHPGPSVFQCSVHPWMSAWAVATDNPFCAKTGADGRFSIEALPPGEYTIEAWHEPDMKLEAPEPKTIRIGAGEKVEGVEFVFTWKG